MSENNANDVSKTVSMRCKECGGILEGSGNELVCPYCGSKELVLDSDAVAVEKIRNETYREFQNKKIEKEEKKEEKESAKSFLKSKLGKILIAAFVICLIASISSFRSGHILAGLLAIVQMGLFGVAWCMGMGFIEEKKPFLHTLMAVIGFVLIIPFFMLSNSKPVTKFTWPESGLATRLPKPESNKGKITFDTEENFWVDVDKTTKDQYEKYLSECKDMGYTVEADSSGDIYEAFDAEGYKLELRYSESMSEMTIQLEPPMEMGDFRWPNSEIAKLIPIPKSSKGRIEWEAEYGFVIYVADTSQDEFNSYADACSDKGFNVDYSRGDTYYRAENPDGYKLDLSYEGNNTMFVRMDEPDKKDDEAVPAEPDSSTETAEEITPDTTEEISTEDTTEVASEETIEEASETEEVDNGENVDGVTPEFKKTMDEYEAFFDEYVEYMKNMKSKNSLGAAVDYVQMLDKYNKYMKELDEMDESKMTKEDHKYFLDTMNRINKKLIDVS